MSHALKKIAIGGKSTRGLGAGGDPSFGERAAEISADQLEEAIEGADMVFITAGMGGGTGTGASPVIAEIARHQHALTVGVVTTPFGFEGQRRRRLAEEGVARIRDKVDALIVIPNDRLMQLADRQMTVVQAFRLADDVLRQGVQGISDLVTLTGLINLDFADIRTVMSGAGTALMAIGEAKGEGRAMLAARAAISSPLLDASIAGARSVLVNVTGGPDLTLAEVTEAANAVSEAVDPSANIIFGAVIHPRAQETFKITVIATGLPDADERPRRAAAQELRHDAPAPPRAPARPASEFPPDSNDDLDLPAFLRRRRL
jgi:cell division protein FtsZ